jgi:predicted transcriptional regulator
LRLRVSFAFSWHHKHFHIIIIEELIPSLLKGAVSLEKTGNTNEEIAHRLGRSLDDIRRGCERYTEPEQKKRWLNHRLMVIARSACALLPASSHHRLKLAQELESEANRHNLAETLMEFKALGLTPSPGSC